MKTTDTTWEKIGAGCCLLLAGALFGTSAVLHAQSSAGPSYTYVDLGPALSQGVPRLAGKNTAAWGINDSRTIVGDGDSDQVGWRYAAGTATQVIAGGSALAINNAGVIVGGRGLGDAAANANRTETTAAVRYENGTLQTIVSGAGRYAVPRAISNTGHIVGEFDNNNGDTTQGFRWFQGTTILIGAADGYTQAYGVNDAGDVVGAAIKPGADDGTAFLWRSGTLTYLTTGFSRADDINNRGVIVGNGDNEGAFRYADGALTRLGQLSGFDRHQPAAINEAGVIVGTAEKFSSFGGVAVVWLNDQPRDLNTLVTLPAGRALAAATAINAAGDIVGYDDRGQAFLLQAGPAAPVTNPGRLINLSVLTSLDAAGDTFSLGYVVSGASAATPKPLVIRAVGPSLGALGVAGTLDDPKLELFAGPAKTGENDNWSGAASIANAMAAVGAFAYAGPASRDAAVAASITSRDNSVKISAGAATPVGTGTVIAELYDATPVGSFTATTPRLVNVSVLKSIGASLTAGFVIGGVSAKTLLVRAVGPGLAAFGVGGTVADPKLELFNGAVSVATNDNWGGTAALSAAFTTVGAFGLDAASKDAALLMTLQPGNYSVQVGGIGGTGTALVEIYEVP